MDGSRSLVVCVALASCVAQGDDVETSQGDDVETSQGDDETTDASTTGPAPITPEDCAALATRAECEAAEVVAAGLGQCVWVSVLTPAPDCTPISASSDRCLGVSGTDPGCAGIECADGTVNAFHRTTRAGIEVFANPTCGLEPAGWTSCAIDPSAPPECACARAP